MVLTETILSFGDAAITAILGYAVVFFGLILLMIVMVLFGKFFTLSAKKQTAKKTVTPAPAVEAPTAPGSAGDIKLYNVEPKTAAMLMAITADKLQKPLNELRFISIKEVEE